MGSTGRASIIETLSAGFTVVHRWPWLIGFPVLIDLSFWQGPRVSVAPVVEGALAWYEGFVQRNPGLAGVAAEGSEQALKQARDLSEGLAQGNLLHLLAWHVPSLVSGVGTVLGEAALLPQWQISSLPMALLAALGLLIIGLLGTALYLGAVALGVREGGISGTLYLNVVRLGWLRLMGFYALIVGGALPAGFVALLVMGIGGLFSPVVLSLLSTLVLSLFLLAALYLAFADEAIFVSDAGSWQALRQSVGLVARFFWSALAFLLLSNIIAAGLTIVWVRLFAVHPAAAVAAIAGHAYIATGLAAAAMVFYRSRAATASGTPWARGIPV